MKINITKSIAAVLLCWLVSAGAMASAASGQYTINGKIEGAAEGMKVYLQEVGWEQPRMVDTTTIENGKFTFTGSLSLPTRYRIIIDRTPEGGKPSERNWLASTFYLENSDITYAGHVDSLPTYYFNRKRAATEPVITGSATQDESVAFKASLRDLGQQLRAISDEYLKVYHTPAMEGKMNTKEGIALVRKENALSEQIQKRKWQYIKDNPKSVVAYDQAMEYFYGMFVTLTVKEINQLVKLVNRGWSGTPQMEKLAGLAEKAKKTAIGTKYQDFELTTPEGSKVMLSKYVPKGKYVLLEFWASWCGPCRAEIPHLRDVYQTKGDKFKIVSISLDESDEAWRKAMEEEGMVWTQLVDPKAFEGEIAQAYNILGIPFSLMLDKKGRIMKVDMRGAYLDATLEDLKI